MLLPTTRRFSLLFEVSIACFAAFLHRRHTRLGNESCPRRYNKRRRGHADRMEERQRERGGAVDVQLQWLLLPSFDFTLSFSQKSTSMGLFSWISDFVGGLMNNSTGSGTEGTAAGADGAQRCELERFYIGLDARQRQCRKTEARRARTELKGGWAMGVWVGVAGGRQGRSSMAIWRV